MKPQKRQLAELRANRVEPVKPITRFVSLPTLESLETGQTIKRDRVSTREPSARELLAEKLQAELEKILPEKTAKSAARKVTGYGYPLGLIDVTPAGIPLWAYEGGQSLGKAAEAAGEGRYGTAAFEGALGALSLAPAAKPAAAGAKAVGKQAAKAIDRAMMTGEGPLGAALAGVRPQFVTAYHGTPHKFPPVRLIEMPDGTRLYQNMTELAETPQGARIIREFPAGRFDLSKIGTGEGAQAYGHGLYFAESPEVAKEYQKQLAGGLPKWNFAEEAKSRGIENYEAIRKVFHENALSDAPLGIAAKRIRNASAAAREIPPAAIEGLIKALREQRAGSLYKVDIPDEAVARMLDWDKPLKEQAEQIQKIARNIGAGKAKGPTAAKMKAFIAGEESPERGIVATGEDLYRALSDYGGESVAGSEALRQAGIPGIKYLDQGSRGTGAGTRNFVLFSEDLPRILEVNEKPTGAKPWAPGEWGGKSAEVDYGRLGMNAPEFRTAPKSDLEATLAAIRARNEEKGLPTETGTGAIRAEIARRYAVEMLGLPENNTAMDRARAMGVSEAYHGTKQDITGGFNPGYEDKLSFVTESPEFANQWIGKGKLQSRIGAEQEAADIEAQARNIRHSAFDYEALNKLEGDEFNQAYDQMLAAGKKKHAEEIGLPAHAIHNVVYPMQVRATRTFHPEQNFDELAEFFAQKDISRPQDIEPYQTGSYLMYETPEMVNYLSQRGFDAMKLRESLGGDYSTLALFDPSQVRSRFAAFDPARMNENDLLGYANLGILPYVGGLGALGALGLSQIEEKPKKKGTKNGK